MCLHLSINYDKWAFNIYLVSGIDAYLSCQYCFIHYEYMVYCILYADFNYSETKFHIVFCRLCPPTTEMNPALLGYLKNIFFLSLFFFNLWLKFLSSHTHLTDKSARACTREEDNACTTCVCNCSITVLITVYN